jgi:hypothetical protein
MVRTVAAMATTFRRALRGLPALTLCAAALFGGCQRDADGDAPATAGVGPCEKLGATPLRRLTKAQYENTVVDLFGPNVKPGSEFPGANVAGGFSNNLTFNVVDESGAEAIMHAAEAVSAQVVKQLPSLIACDAAKSGEDACFEAFVTKVVRRAYRRPVTADESALLKKVFQKTRPDSTFADAIGAALEVVLQSPQFLYLSESGDAKTADARGRVRLTDHEVASRLSYLMWDAMPDDALMAEADGGRLRTSAQVSEQARRMLADPRAKRVVSRFHSEWLGVNAMEEVAKDAKLYPSYTPALASAMREETERFAEAAFFGGGTFATLYRGGFTYVNADLAKLYGIPFTSKEQWARVDLDPKQRAGLLTQASVLATFAHPEQTSPVLRGKFVRVSLMCDTISPPPADVMTMFPEVSANLPIREQLAQHRNNPACKGCHDMMDPIGFGFEHYDAIGKYRTNDAHGKVDASGEILGTKAPLGGKFDGAIELSSRLADSQDAQYCMAVQWFRYAHGRQEDGADVCQIDAAFARWRERGLALPEVLVAITESEDFLYRNQAIIASP